MFKYERHEDGHLTLHGRIDAANADQFKALLDGVHESCTIDFQELLYISSIGLGVLANAQSRLMKSGHGLRIVNLNNHIRNVFQIAGFDNIFDIA